MQASVDTLIIGHGLAGAILAHKLIARGQSVLVLDHAEESSASQVAAGIINPVTGHRLNITDGFEQFMPTALSTYRELSKLLGEEIYSPIPQSRLLKNQGQFDYLSKRRTEPQYDKILRKHTFQPDYFLESAYGSVAVKQSGIVNTRKLLALSRNFLLGKNAYHSLEVDYQGLNLHEDGVSYQGIKSARVIFCEGHRATNNPWLQNLPFKLAKGEIVNLEIKTDLRHFLNWGNWLIPDAQPNRFRLGSTYEWRDLSLTATKGASLLENLQRFTGLRGHLLSIDVGIRPTTVHRIPFVGALNRVPNSYCFNGFGSKGCLLIPTYANRLVDHIIQSKPLPRETSRWL